MNRIHRLFEWLPVLLIMQACSPGHFAGSEAKRDLLLQPELAKAQVGICIYDPAAARYLYQYQADKYFIPASNTKLFTFYAGLKYLGDSLVGIRYLETDSAVFLKATGDPTFLHPDFPQQRVITFLQRTGKKIYLFAGGWQEKPFGRGWAWDDYNEDFMAERSPLPVYGNRIRWVQDASSGTKPENSSFESTASIYSIPEVDWKVRFTADTAAKAFNVQREKDENIFRITEGKEKYKTQDVPFITNGYASAILLLKDTAGKEIHLIDRLPMHDGDLIPLFSRPADSLFKPMMWNSDNFFAEQGLLMAGNEKLGKMNDAGMIDYLLRNDLQGLPQKPVWVDGSGLSRYNLFTPQDFIWLLDKMSKEFGLSRIKGLLPTGGAGTLAHYYLEDSAYIYAKTGSMSGVVSLCGYLITEKGRTLIFSVLVNNNAGNATGVRRRIEKLIHTIRERY